MAFGPWLKWLDLRDELSRPTFVLIVALIVIPWYIFLIKLNNKNKKPPLPPGPRGLPLLGNLPFLDSNLHSCLAKLATTYGPLMKIRLGTRLCVIVSSPSVAKEVLKDHDTVFAHRDVPALAVAGEYGLVDIVWSPPGDHWRMLRKICVRELLSNSRLESLYGLRRQEVCNLVSLVYSKIGEPVNIGEQVLLAMFNIMTNMLWGGTLEDAERKRVRSEFKQVLDRLTKLIGELDISDLWPVLAIFDLQGTRHRMRKIKVWFDQIFDSVIDKRIKLKSEGKFENSKTKHSDFLEVLLEFMEHGDHKLPFTTTHIKAMFVDIMGAGTASSSTTVEWAMAELMQHPEKLRKAQDEIEKVVGINNTVEESHLPNLNYVNAVMKETLRLHPIGPVLIPRCPSESRIVGGYLVPKGCKLLVNAWAIHRDPDSWDNPLEFQPERFLDSSREYDFTGKTFSYIPFGSGRRVCAGIPMAERMVPYLLSTLLHSFSWKLLGNTKLDLSETFGLELRKTTPLIVIPTPRLSDTKLYTSRPSQVN